MNNINHVLFLLRKVDCNDGIASYCRLLSSELMSRKISVSMISGEIFDSKIKTNSELQKRNLVNWISIPSIRQIPNPFLFIKLVLWIKKNKITIINAHGLGMLIWGKLLSLASGVALIATYHPSFSADLSSTKASANKSFTFLQKLVLRLFIPDKLIVLSEESKDFLIEQCGILKSRIVKIYGGIDEKFFRAPTNNERLAARENLNIADNDFVCLLVGRTVWNKGHDLLIRAARDIRQNHPSIRLKCIFVGSGGQSNEIEKFALVDDEDRNSFLFLGYVKDQRRILWAADIFVLPSRIEGFALAVVEAMGTGLVPIRTPSGGAVDQIIEGKTGHIVPFEDVKALADAMLNLTNSDKRLAMSSNCISLVHTKFSKKIMVDKIIGCINDLAKEPQHII